MLEKLFKQSFVPRQAKGAKPTTKTNSQREKTKTILKASEHIEHLTEGYVLSSEAKKNIAKAYIAKRPKGYGEIYSPIYNLSYYATTLLHIFSLVIALPFVTILVGFFAQQIGLPIGEQTAYIIAAGFLASLEIAQHSTLNVMWNIYFQDGKFAAGITVVAIIFSAFSVASSGYSAYHFLQGSQFVIWGLAISIGNEALINWLSHWRHKYEWTTRQESQMVNDLYRGKKDDHLFTKVSKNDSSLGKERGQQAHKMEQ